MSDIEDLFDYDAGLDDVLQNLPSAQDKETSQTENDNNDAEATKVLGLDTDIKPTKQRAPTAKLDEARLLSQKGIPKLRKDVRIKLKFKGKGHEFSDLGRLLNFYQLWLDDLYPRAKFADGLAMIEKLGHTKRVQIMRREWIDEEKPNYRRRDDNNDNSNNYDYSTSSTAERNERSADGTTTNNNMTNDTPLDDELGDFFVERPRREFAPKQGASSRPNDDVPPDDDLDMLLAEAENVTFTPKINASNEPSTEGAPLDDDLDMLLAEAENTNSGTRYTASNEATASGPVTERNNDDGPPNDDLDMLLAEAESITGDGGRKSIFN